MELPVAEDATGWVIWMERVAGEALPLRVALTTAATPFPIVVLFKPQIRHVTDPADVLQDKDLFAPVARAPAAALTAVNSAGL